MKVFLRMNYREKINVWGRENKLELKNFAGKVHFVIKSLFIC